MLKRLYPDQPTARIARHMRRPIYAVHHKAVSLGLKKSPAFFANAKVSGRFSKLTRAGIPFRFPKGHIPANMGLRRPGYGPGRMRETQFKRGHWPANRDPDYYVFGALRVNTDGYIDMRVSFAPGALGWRALHTILWEDAHGPVPPGYCLAFKDGDRLNVELANFELISHRERLRRNTVHNLPQELAQVVLLRGALVRQINRREKHEEQDRRSA